VRTTQMSRQRGDNPARRKQLVPFPMHRYDGISAGMFAHPSPGN